MLSSRLITLSSMLATALAADTGGVTFVNHCSYPIYFFQVGLGKAGEDWDAVTVPASGMYTQPLAITEGKSGGVSVKIRDIPKYRVAPAGILQFEYNLHPTLSGKVWYDLSLVDCDVWAPNTDPVYCPLIKGGVKMYVPEDRNGSCQSAACDATGCDNAYLEPGPKLGDPTWSCPAGSDVHVETCVNGDSPVTVLKDASKVPAPNATEPKPVGPLTVTDNGLCGSKLSKTCTGGAFGPCCSKWDNCGSSDEYCGSGCQTGFGTCWGSKRSLSTLLTMIKPLKSVEDQDKEIENELVQTQEQTEAEAEPGNVGPVSWTHYVNKDHHNKERADTSSTTSSTHHESSTKTSSAHHESSSHSHHHESEHESKSEHEHHSKSTKTHENHSHSHSTKSHSHHSDSKTHHHHSDSSKTHHHSDSTKTSSHSHSHSHSTSSPSSSSTSSLPLNGDINIVNANAKEHPSHQMITLQTIITVSTETVVSTYTHIIVTSSKTGAAGHAKETVTVTVGGKAHGPPGE